MKYPLTMLRAMLLATLCVLLQQSGVVLAQQDGEAAPLAGTRPAMNALTAQPVGNAPGVAASGALTTAATGVAESQGNVAELMQMIHGTRLNELRTTYNGSYGASLFFYPQEMTYYVALFQDKHFWRVIKSEDAARSELVYADFVRQTVQLADVEIRRTQLLAQKAYIEDIIALSEDRAKRLQADLDVARAQQAKVNDHQRQTQSEAAALRVEKEKAQAQLRQVQGQVLQLQQQTESGLPLQK